MKPIAELKAARAAAAQRYADLGVEMLKRIGLTEPTQISSNLSGHAGKYSDGRIILKAPWPASTRRRLYVLAHEIGHVELGHQGAGRAPRHVEEMEAEQFAHRLMREHGVPVPKKMTAGAQDYVARKIIQAAKAGAKHIDAEALRYAGFKANPNGTYTRLTFKRRPHGVSAFIQTVPAR